MRITSKINKIILLALLSLGGLSACGGGAETEGNSASAVQQTEDDFLKGAGTEALGYYNEVWKNLSDKNRCGRCHNASHGQAPQFVDANDNSDGVTLNDNYQAVRPYVNFASPGDSILVTKIRDENHQPQACWLGGDQAACASAIQSYIVNWNNLTSTTDAVPGYTLVAPSPLRDVANSKSFPVSSADFGTDLYPLLVNRCSTCHASPTRQGATGSFASSDRDQAYQEARQKIDLLDPANSRLVYRLRAQSHNCWDDPDTPDPGVDCVYSSQVMEDAVTAFANTISTTPIDSNLIVSKAMKLQPPEAIMASGGERHISNQIALWEFKKGSGNQAFDTSNVEPLMHLSLSGDYNWVGGYGIQFRNGQAQASYQTSQKLIEEAELRQEYSIEAWVIPSVDVQRKDMISYSGGSTSRNFALSQYDKMYQINSRSDQNLSGVDFVRSEDGSVQTSQQHIVVTYDSAGGNRVYVNGVYTEDATSTNYAGALKDGDDKSIWNDKFSFILGNAVGDFTGNKAWQGIFRMVAVHNRVLSDEQITKNFKAGVGEKFILLFSISDVPGVPDDSYIKVQAEQFDTYGYLFSNPEYINLGNPVPAINIPIAGMRVGINGKEAVVGQSFINLSINTITENNQEISRLGTMVEVQQGTQVDDFFLTFETLGSVNNPFVVATPAAPAVPADLEAHSEIGVRTFSEINATMSELTGIPTSNSTVFTTYTNLKQQLPSTENINAFVPANIIGISQLAFEYCDQLVENTEGNRAAILGAFDFNSNVDTAFNVAGDTATEPSNEKKQLVNALYDRMIGIPAVALGAGLSSAPTRAETTTELVDPDNNVVGDPFADPVVPGNEGNLFDRLKRSCGIDDPANNQVECSTAKGTRDFVKAMCTSVLGSAAMLIQ